jgi:type II secretory pathway pseudopilin PulG
MKRLTQESGFTIVELLVGMIMSLIVFAATLSLLDTYQHQSKTADQRNQVQDAARTAIDQMTRQLRNVAAESPTSAGALERSDPTDLVFQTVNGTSVTCTSVTSTCANASNQMRVRYCLNTSNPTNEVLWMQTQTWTTATGPSVPVDNNACPTSGSGWTSSTRMVTNITNYSSGQAADDSTRRLFTYAPIGATAPAEINFIEVDLFLDVNPGHHPGETEIRDGIFLRNSFASPTAGMTIDTSTGNAILNGSSSLDPNGQALSYQWSVNGSAISGATSQQYTYPTPVASLHGQYTFGLTVTSTGGLSGSTSKTVTFP